MNSATVSATVSSHDDPAPESYRDRLCRLSETVSKTPGPHLVGIDECRVLIFPDEDSAPAARTWKKWQAAKFFRIHKIGRRVFGDPEEIRADLTRRFRVSAIAAK